LTDYDQAVRLNPNFDAAYYNRGVVYQEKDEYDRAISDFDRAIRLNPNDADYYNHRGNAFYAKGDYDRAPAEAGLCLCLLEWR
jgi:tetratricopeptide (TPR) repeat protein